MKFSSFLNFNSFAFGVSHSHIWQYPVQTSSESKSKRGNQGSRSSWPQIDIAIDSTLAIGNRACLTVASLYKSSRLVERGRGDCLPINLLTKGPSNQNKTHTAKRGLAPPRGEGGEAGQLAHLNIDMIPILFANIVEGGVEWRVSGGRPYNSSHN